MENAWMRIADHPAPKVTEVSILLLCEYSESVWFAWWHMDQQCWVGWRPKYPGHEPTHWALPPGVSYEAVFRVE